MQFKVPQFLEIEDKIFGPFTFREFIYLAGGAGICFVLYKLLGIFWGALPILAVGIFSGMLTFYKPNNKPFIEILEAGFKYGVQSKLYIWKRRKPTASTDQNKRNSSAQENMSLEERNMVLNRSMRLSGNKLRDLAWSLDVLDLKKEN